MGQPAVQRQREHQHSRPSVPASDYLSRRTNAVTLFGLGLSSETAAHAAQFIRVVASRARKTSDRSRGIDPLKLASLSGIKSWCRIPTDEQVISYVRAIVALGAVQATDLHPVAREICKLDTIHADPVFAGVNRAGDDRLANAIAKAPAESQTFTCCLCGFERSFADQTPSSTGDGRLICNGCDDAGDKPDAAIDDDGEPRAGNPASMSARERYRTRTFRLPASDLKRLAALEAAGRGGAA